MPEPSCIFPQSCQSYVSKFLPRPNHQSFKAIPSETPTAPPLKP